MFRYKAFSAQTLHTFKTAFCLLFSRDCSGIKSQTTHNPTERGTSDPNSSQLSHVTSICHYNPCSALPCTIRCLMLRTSSLSSRSFIHAAYSGYFCSRPPDLPSSANKPSPTKFQVTKDKSAKVHLSPTNQPLPLALRPSSSTPITRSISLA